jgi:7-cyano-7-deazaguanine synthase
MQTRKLVVSFSGGADSTTLLYEAIHMRGKENVQPVYFFYGQKHAPGEREAVKSIAAHLGISIPELAIDLKQFGRSPLTDHSMPVPTKEQNKQASTVVPFRNTMFLVMAAAYATVNEFDDIGLGPTREDLPEYPDCRPAYIDAMQAALRLADRHHHLNIETPYIDMWKSDVIEIGLELGVPYGLTHTCYNGVWQTPCRECDACHEREDSFMANGIVDPLLQVKKA